MEIHEDKIVMRAGKYNLPKPWQDLTTEEFNDCLVEGDPCECLAEPEAWAVMQAVAAKLKEKNA